METNLLAAGRSYGLVDGLGVRLMGPDWKLKWVA